MTIDGIEANSNNGGFPRDDLARAANTNALADRDRTTSGASAWLPDVREHRWAEAWEHAWQCAPAPPGSAARRELVARAVRWLGELTHGRHWVRVWTLVALHGDRHPGDVDRGEHLRTALTWMAMNDRHPRWGDVLLTALPRRAALAPATFDLPSRLLDAARWLAETPRTVGWAKTLKFATRTAANQGLTEILQRLCAFAFTQLGDEDSPFWSEVWVSLWKVRREALDDAMIGELVARGLAWVAAREGPQHDRAKGPILAPLLHVRPVAPSLVAEAWAWVGRNASDWRCEPIVTELDRADPDSPHAAALPRHLRRRSCATGSAVVAANDVEPPRRRTGTWVTVPRELEAVWQGLLDAQRSASPVHGRIVEASPGGYIVDVGFRVFAPTGTTWLQPGDAVALSGLAVARESRAVAFDGLKPVALPPDGTVVVGGEEQGCVESTVDYGLFVRFRGFVGLMHRHEMGGAEPSSYAVGQRLRVTILAINGTRLTLGFAGIEVHAA
jgi:hypothetical protein